MSDIFSDIEIIQKLRKIADSLEENEIMKNQLYAYITKTGLYPIQCDCERGIERIKCKKCGGYGYILVKKEDTALGGSDDKS